MVAYENTTPDSEVTPAITESATPAAAAGMGDHKEYFWDVVRFKIGGTRFQLPLHPFIKESEVFAAQYGLCDNPSRDGLTTSVVELDVDLKDFECFLKAFVPQSFTVYDSKPMLSKTEWISIIKLATKWKFNDLRKTAVDNLNWDPSLTTMERTMLAKEYQIPDWLLQGYRAFVSEMQADNCTSGRGLTRWKEEDASKIGWNVVVELQSIVLGRYRSMLQNLPPGDVNDDILASELLREEYEAMKETSQAYCTREEIRMIEERQERDCRLAEEIEAKRKAEEAEAKRLADEECMRAAQAEQRSQAEKDLEAKREERQRLVADLKRLDEELVGVCRQDYDRERGGVDHLSHEHEDPPRRLSVKERKAMRRAQFERAETERVEAERVEAERIEAERVEAERAEAEREAKRIEAERLEAERLEAELLEPF